MKKIKIFLTAVMSVMLFAGCVEDNGNYDYRNPDEVAPIILTEFDAGYTAIMLEMFRLDPQVRGNEEDYEYFWCTYPAGVTTQNRRDTIGYERKLDYYVSLAPGSYNLVFQAKDKVNGTSDFQTTRITVASSFSTGYYITKYENGRTDIDFINNEGEIKPNILKTINGEDLPGKPVRSTLSDRYCFPEYDDEGNSTTLTWQQTIMVTSEEDIRIYRGNDLTEIYAGEEAFMAAPNNLKPQGVWGTSSGFMMVNDGQVHTVRGNIYSDGRFSYGYPKEGLELDGRGACGTACLILYDANKGELVAYHNTQDRYAYTGVYTGYEQHHFTNQDFVAAVPHYSYFAGTPRAFVLFKSKEAGEVGKLRLVDVIVGLQSVRTMAYYGSYEVPDDAANIANGKIFSMLNGYNTTGDNSVMFYSTGDNKVHYYDYMNQRHVADAVTIPPDEEITYIFHYCDYYCNGGHPTYSAPYPDGFNTFIVLSTKGGNWILREYGMLGSTPDIDKESGPKATYTGTGVATHLFGRIPHTTRTW